MAVIDRRTTTVRLDDYLLALAEQAAAYVLGSGDVDQLSLSLAAGRVTPSLLGPPAPDFKGPTPTTSSGWTAL